MPNQSVAAAAGAHAGYSRFSLAQVRALPRRVILVVAAIVLWSFTSDFLTLVSTIGASRPDQEVLLAAVALGALTFGVLVSAIRSTVGTAVVLVGATLQILEDPPLLAAVVMLVNTLLVAYTAGRSFARVQVGLAAAWLVLHVVLVPGNQWLIWGYIPCLLGLHILGTQLARLHDDNLLLMEQARREKETQRVAVKAERRNIARDLHDIVAHDMTLVAMQADAARLSDDPERVRMFLDGISDASHQSLHDLRVMMKVLASRAHDAAPEKATPVSNQSLRREIEDAADRLTKLAFVVDVRVEGDLDQVYRASQVALAPVIRECATNIVKHTGTAESRFATMEVSALAGELTIRVTSGPIGATLSGRRRDGESGHGSGVPSGKFGLLCLAERMQLMGGTFSSGAAGNRWIVETSLREGLPVT